MRLVVVRVPSMLTCCLQAAAGLNTYLIRDAGHTEIDPGSRTVLAVGPAPASAMDPLTRHLKPY